MNRSVVLSRRRRSLGVLVLVGLVAALAGCQGGKPTGSVTGKVTYKGAPVTTGTVNFFAPERGAGFDAKLDSSGAFTIAQPVDAGSYKVYVSPPQMQQLPPGQVAKKEPFNVPKKYQDASQTTLTFEVKAGKNDFPIAIPD